MKKLAKRKKPFTDTLYQNRELHPESTVGNSLPLHTYVEILSDACTLTYFVYSFLCAVCMYAHV